MAYTTLPIVRVTMLLSLLSFDLPLIAQTADKHSHIDAQAQYADQQLKLVFKAIPAPAHLMTFEGPWQLDIKSAPGVKLPKMSFPKVDLDEQLPGFKFASQGNPEATSGDIDYKLIAFVCTKDKTRCYREVHTGQLHWKK